jgi:pSer/pThr/pTyr-binding forkhead associated (FHA) protein
LIKTEGLGNQALELRLGVNRVGRDPDCELCINHFTVSSVHCELALSNDGVYLRDCDSTNGTFINGDPIKETWLLQGQELRLGDVELLVESVEANIVIPQFETERPKPPVVLEDGLMVCPRHTDVSATFKCTHCQEIMCNSCVHILRRKGGKAHFLCPICSHACERLGVTQVKKKKGFLEMLQETVKLKFKQTVSRKGPVK